MLASAVALFAGLMVLGSLATLALYRFDLGRLGQSTLGAKIMVWIPIFAGYLVLVYGGWMVRLGLLLLVSVMIAREYLRQTTHHPALRRLLYVAFIVIVAALWHFA